ALVSVGQAYYGKICVQCHGIEGRGKENIPRIAGQQLNYLNETLTNYRNGTNIRKNPLMAASTRLMTDADIAAASAYVSSMK
ncbi:MAG: c-type cytochrome, partial [Polaromonas sp.]